MLPIVKSLPSHIKDTNHALKIFRDFTFSGEIIPYNEGLLVLKFYFYQRSTKEPISETLLLLAELRATDVKYLLNLLAILS